MDKAQLKSDIANAEMNMEHLQQLYEERACLCEEQCQQIAELDIVLANYPYIVHVENGTICAENYEGYKAILKAISKVAVEDFADGLKPVLFNYYDSDIDNLLEERGYK
jgi:hypothetical protein